MGQCVTTYLACVREGTGVLAVLAAVIMALVKPGWRINEDGNEDGKDEDDDAADE